MCFKQQIQNKYFLRLLIASHYGIMQTFNRVYKNIDIKFN